MAAGADQSIVKQLDDITECSICSERFTDPRSLPCVRSFCMTCVERFARDEQPVKKEKPVIVMSSGKVEATKSESVRFESTVTGEPEPSVDWFQNGVKLTPSSRTVIEKNGNVCTLVMNDVVEQDEGQYTVRANNSEGTTEAVATRTVKALIPTVPTLTHVIPKGSSCVAGVTSLNTQLFVICHSAQQQIEVYNTTTFTILRNIYVTGLNTTFGLTSCVVNNCLYVTEYNSNLVFRVELLPSSNTVTKWSVGKYPSGISTNSANNVIVTCNFGHNIREYTTHGSLIRDICLSSAGITNPRCSIQLSNGHIAISCIGGACLVNNNGALIRNRTNTNEASVQFSNPRGFAVAQSGCTLMADCGTNQLVLFNPSFTSVRVLSLPSDSPLSGPWSIFLDESRGRLYVGEWGGGRVLVFDNVFNVGSDFRYG